MRRRRGQAASGSANLRDGRSEAAAEPPNREERALGGDEEHRPVAVVTGAARGIGKGCAEALGRRGFELVLVDVLEGELAATVEGFGRGGVAAQGFVADVADHRRAREVADEVLERRAAIDVLVNNAGTPMPKGLHIVWQGQVCDNDILVAAVRETAH